MHLHVIACSVMTREISLLAATCENSLRIHYMKQGLHTRPDELRNAIQGEIDAIDAAVDTPAGDPDAAVRPDPDAIVLAYGLCSNGICGLRSRYYRIVAPRAHDCIALILGSRERYREQTERHAGTYWYTPGWIEQTPMPGRERVAALRREYVERYGAENADYLMDMEQDWLRAYNRCAYVAWPALHKETYRRVTRDSASYLEWEYAEVPGDDDLLRRLLGGPWDDDFLIVPPGSSIVPSFSESVIRSSE